MFLLLQPMRLPGADGGKMELTMTSTNISLIRLHCVLERQLEFTIQLKDCITKLAERFNRFLHNTSALAQRNNDLLIKAINPRALLNNEVVFKEEEHEDLLNLFSSSHEDILGRPLTGIERCDIPEAFHGSRKHMIKICNYWIFYNSIVCEGTFAEPTLREHNL